MSTVVEARDVFRVYSTPSGSAAALQGLTLKVAEGEIVTALGPSGSGKTSLLRIVAGLDRPSAGTVRVLGLDVGRVSRRRLAAYRSSSLGYLDQHYARALSPELSAQDLIALRLRLSGESRAGSRARADELLDRIGLRHRAASRPRELSGGEQQRIAVCSALAHRPRLLVADEPTGELDAENAATVYELIAELVRDHRCTALLVSHDPASTRIADRTLHIRDGRVSEERGDGAENDELIVIGRGGWLRLSDELLQRARIGSRARARAEGDSIVVTGVDGTGAEPDASPDSPGLTTQASAGGRVELAGVTKAYGSGDATVEALDGIDVVFEAARFHVVTGPSGSGKTTLLQLVAGLELPTAGRVVALGSTVSGLDREERALLRRDHVGVVPQQSRLIPFLTAVENVELALAVRGRDEQSRGYATEALAVVGLAERSEHRVSLLSSGEQIRVAIARALAARPSILLADEPTARLDRAGSVALAALFRQLAAGGVTVICATHDPLIIEQADRELALAPLLPEGRRLPLVSR
jgi:ABC-type lipoprotein export system ATPase subunit